MTADTLETYGLLVSFPDQSEAFTLGVEAGMFWQRIQSGERAFYATVHAENIECLARMARAVGAVITEQPHLDCEGWKSIEVSPAPPPLRVIQGGLSRPFAPGPEEG